MEEHRMQGTSVLSCDGDLNGNIRAI